MLKHLFCKIPTEAVLKDKNKLFQFISENAYIDCTPCYKDAHIQFITLIKKVPDEKVLCSDRDFYEVSYAPEDVLSVDGVKPSVAIEDSLLLSAKRYLESVLTVDPENKTKLILGTYPHILSAFYCEEEGSFCIVTCVYILDSAPDYSTVGNYEFIPVKTLKGFSPKSKKYEFIRQLI